MQVYMVLGSTGQVPANLQILTGLAMTYKYSELTDLNHI
jgi:hypothetical protein